MWCLQEVEREGCTGKASNCSDGSYLLLPHNAQRPPSLGAAGTKPHSSSFFSWRGPAPNPCPPAPAYPPQASPGAFREGTCPRVGSQEQDLELPALHETLKGRPLDLTPALCRGREKGGLSCPRPPMGASPLPPLAFVESKLRIKASPGASWAWAQLRQDRVFQCLEPKGKY